MAVAAAAAAAAAADAASRSAVSWLLRRSEIMAPVVVDLKWGKMGRKGKNGKKRAPQCGRETELIGIRSSRFHRLNLAFFMEDIAAFVRPFSLSPSSVTPL